MTAYGDSRLGRHWPVILAWAVALAAVIALLAALLGQRSTTVVRTVIVRNPSASAPVSEDTPTGALAAAQAFWAASDAAAGGLGSWTLEYRLDSYSAAAATLEGWGLARDSNGTRWQTVKVTMHYSRGSWRPPATGAGVEVSLDPMLDPLSPAFSTAIESFHRLPGAP